MKIIVTCGPSIEPIDRVRCITNFSTGELGILLANALSAAGHDVTCLKAVRATFPQPLTGARRQTFETSEDLRQQLQALAGEKIEAIFHTAALGDFRVVSIRSGEQVFEKSGKISSATGELEIRLAPAPKLIAELRPLFPLARIVGWKYELEGDRETALARARRQLEKNGTDACVLNGDAYGPGFGFCEPGAAPVQLADKPTLCAYLARWLRP